MWSSTRILWDQQVFLMWLLLPPIFLVCGLLALAAPFLVRSDEGSTAEDDEKFIPDQAVAAERRN